MKLFIVSCILLSVAFAEEQAATPSNTLLQECFEKDSISCVQSMVYRRAKEFFDQPSISVFGGLSFAKDTDRSGKSLNTEPEPKVEDQASVQARELALEDFLFNRVKNFFQERSLSWNFASASRSLSNAIPDDVKESVRAFVVEGRTKKLKQLKKLLPLLGILKLKLAALAVLAIAGIAVIAKKALITSLIAIAIAGAGLLGSIVAKLFGLKGAVGSVGTVGLAGLSGLKGLGGLGGIGGIKGLGGLGGIGGLGGSVGGLGGLGGLRGGGGGGNGGGGGGGYGGGSDDHSNVEEIIAYNTDGGGWSSGGGGGWNSGWDNSGSHSQPIAQTIAYSGHHKLSRR